MGLTEFIAATATHIIAQTGYSGVFIFMTMESMVLPVPSEAVMPFAGFLIAEKTFSFINVIIVSTLASITGSLISYYAGYFGGIPFVKKFGKYLLLDVEELAAAEKFFQKRGDITILICRFIPVIRHLISIPAGVGKMNVIKFSIFTIIGAGLWNAFLAYTGFVLKNNWDHVMKYSHIIDIVVVLFLCGLVCFYAARHLKKRKQQDQKNERSTF
jgi:membrane protein DedA with SNARE-associated domain